jgi:flagellar basal-body rod protein FlgF
MDGSVSQGGKNLGRLQVVTFADPSSLAKMGQNYFQSPDPKLQLAAAKSVEVHQGKIEGSNVGVAESAVHLVGIMRQFEMLQKAVSLAGDMNKSAVEEVARIGS